jgi:hypothetical protein
MKACENMRGPSAISFDAQEETRFYLEGAF